jgi:hypothetical protein
VAQSQRDGLRLWHWHTQPVNVPWRFCVRARTRQTPTRDAQLWRPSVFIRKGVALAISCAACSQIPMTSLCDQPARRLRGSKWQKRTTRSSDCSTTRMNRLAPQLCLPYVSSGKTRISTGCFACLPRTCRQRRRRKRLGRYARSHLHQHGVSYLRCGERIRSHGIDNGPANLRLRSEVARCCPISVVSRMTLTVTFARVLF